MGAETGASKVLYLIVSGSPRARQIHELVTRAHTQQWNVCVIATPSGLKFLDIRAVEELTGHPVRSEYKEPDEPDALPAADAMIVCPATFNTINKWAVGIADTLALGLLTEAIGLGLPLVAAPALNSAQATHPAFARSVTELQAAGVNVLYGPGIWEPGPPGTGSKRTYDWDQPLRALDDLLSAQSHVDRRAR
jgi:phosphopantothenoylcysteine synthetase/decarboxylase